MNNIVRLYSSWGLSDKPGSTEMIINDDGSYTIKMHLLILAEKKEENKSQSGKISPSKLKKIIDFLSKNITKDISLMMFDANYIIEYSNDGNTYKVENDFSLWKKLIVLIPEYTKFQI